MSYPIQRVAVIGAGTMGAAIAAHVANAGLPVVLLDIVPTTLTPAEEKQGLTLQSPAVRNRIVQAGFERARQAKPAAFMSREAERRVSLGNIEDDFAQLAEADWLVEAIIEKLGPKQALLARLETVRKPGSIVSSNTSGLPVATLAEGRSQDFKRHFLGTHFFNPPRYLKLLEIIPAADTDEAVRQTMAGFAEKMLGKEVVFCQDTPNFIGNRLFSISHSFTIHYAFENGYTIEEVDTLTGPLLGRPKTATFRLQDLVGLDVAASVAQNLYDFIPEDAYREVLRSPHLDRIIGELLKRGWLGNKRGQGFYKQAKDAQGQRIFMVLNPATFEYEAPQPPHFEAVEAVGKIEELGQRLTALLAKRWQADRAAQFVWAVLSYELAYAAARAQEIAHDLKSIDEVMRWGFGYEAGPFELWDRLGVTGTMTKMEAAGLEVATWVKEMLAAGCETFYRRDKGQVTGYYDWTSQTYRALSANPRQIKIGDLGRAGPPLFQNRSATLHDMGDRVLLLEIPPQTNILIADIITALAQAHMLLAEAAYLGLVIGNEGDHFCGGIQPGPLAAAAQQGQFDQVDDQIKTLQMALLALRYSPKPVVAAIHGRALGVGAEIALSAGRIVAHAESYLGFVEPGLGLLPAGGGVKELVRRTMR